MKELRDTGWEAEVVERFNHWSKRRHDLFGFVDILAIKPGELPALIQTTTGSNLAARRTKILAEPRARLALLCGCQIVLHGWRKLKVKRGGKAVRWAVLVESVQLEDFA